MKFKRYIEEEYLSRDGDFEIHKNPPLRDMIKISYPGNKIRLLFDMSTGDYYAANSNLLHYLMMLEIGLDEENNKIFRGIAEIKTGKLIITHLYDNYIKFQDADPKIIEMLKDYGVKAEFGGMVYANEEYAFMGKTYKGTPYEIFSNPSTKELMMVRDKEDNKVRFCIDLKEKKLYVWNVNFDHEAAARYAEREGIWEKDSYDRRFYWKCPYIFAVGKIVNNKIEIIHQKSYEGSNIDWDDVEKKFRHFDKDVSWMQHWFTPDSYEDFNEI